MYSSNKKDILSITIGVVFGSIVMIALMLGLASVRGSMTVGSEFFFIIISGIAAYELAQKFLNRKYTTTTRTYNVKSKTIQFNDIRKVNKKCSTIKAA